MVGVLIGASVIVVAGAAISLNASLVRRQPFAIGWRLFAYALISAMIVAGGILTVNRSTMLAAGIVLAGSFALWLIARRDHGSGLLAFARVIALSAQLSVLVGCGWIAAAGHWSPDDRGPLIALSAVPLAVPIWSVRKIFIEAVEAKAQYANQATDILQVTWVACVSEAFASFVAVIATLSLLADGGRIGLSRDRLLVIAGLLVATLLVLLLRRTHVAMRNTGSRVLDAVRRSVVIAAVVPLALTVVFAAFLLTAPLHTDWIGVVGAVLIGFVFLDSLLVNAAVLQLFRVRPWVVLSVLPTAAVVALSFAWLLMVGMWGPDGRPLPWVGVTLLTASCIAMNSAAIYTLARSLASGRQGWCLTESASELNSLQDSIVFQAAVVLVAAFPLGALNSVDGSGPSRLVAALAAPVIMFGVIVWAINNNREHLRLEKLRLPPDLQPLGPSGVTLNAARLTRLTVRLVMQNTVATVFCVLGLLWIGFNL